MDESTLSSPLLPSPAQCGEGSPARSYGSAEDVPALQESALNVSAYDMCMRSYLQLLGSAHHVHSSEWRGTAVHMIV